MGKRGPKPKPTALLKAAGSWRANTRQGEPQPVPEPPPRPSWLGRDEDPLNHVVLEAWDLLSARLSSVKVLSAGDAVALALLCEAIRDYVSAKTTCLEQGETQLTERGEVVHPAARLRDKAFARVLQLLREFGLTPAARTGVQIIQSVEVKVDAGKSRLFAPPS